MRRTERPRWWIPVGWAIGTAALTAVFDDATVFKLGLVAIVFIAALGLHLLVNWCGELSLGQAGFIGVPAFAVVQISTNASISPFLVLPIGVIVGAALGSLVAAVALRARGLQVALVTLAIGIAIGQFFFFQTWLVGPREGLHLTMPTLFGIDFGSSRAMVPVLALTAALAVVGARSIMASKVGRAMLLVRSNADVAAAAGVPVAVYRGMAYAMCGAFAGLAGWAYVMWVQRVNPQAFPLQLGFTYLIIAALAGPGGTAGVAIAALVVQGGELFEIIPHEIIVLVAPAALIVNVTRFPSGVNGLVRFVSGVLATRRRQPVPDAPTDSDDSVVRLPMHRRNPSGPLLELDNVSLSFGGLSVLDDISLQVEAGTIVGLIGPNGAGKTTLLNVITGLQRTDQGRIRLDGADVSRVPAHRRARLGVARSFQNLGLMLDETSVTNVSAALHRTVGYSAADVLVRPWRVRRGERQLRERCRTALTRLDVEEHAERVVSELSFAQARLIEVAAIVAETPRLMLLDEPTTGLDTVEIARLSEILTDVRKDGTTVIVVAHDVDFVLRVCDHVFVLAEGRRLFDGSPTAIRSSPEVIAAYLGRSA